MSELVRHIHFCNNAELPGARWPVFVRGEAVGWTLPDTAHAACNDGADVLNAALHIPAASLQAVARGLAASEICRWRAEAFDVRSHPDGPSLGQIDRGALPALGIGATGVHVNGLVGNRLWVARRATTKPLDPGKLDHIVAGGVASGHDLLETLIKEGEEEARLPRNLCARAVPAGTIDYAMERAEGLRRDRLHVYDLELPTDFVPIPTDGEVGAFELWPLDRVIETVRQTDEFKFNVNLALIALFIRRRLVSDAESNELKEAISRSRQVWSGW